VIQRFFLIISAAWIATGCASAPQPPTYQFGTNTRIGILNHLESFATHENVSELRFGSFTKTYNVDWDIPAYTEQQLTRKLQTDPRYVVVPLSPAGPLSDKKQSSTVIDQMSFSGEIKPNVADFLNALADERDLDVVIVIKNYRGPSPFRIGKRFIPLQGYGLFTRSLVMLNRAYSYAQIAVIVFKTRPLTYLGAGKPEVKDSALKDFNLPDDLKSLPPSVLDKLQPYIQKYADQAIQNALGRANLM
jgi:hypothetical protein